MKMNRELVDWFAFVAIAISGLALLLWQNSPKSLYDAPYEKSYDWVEQRFNGSDHKVWTIEADQEMIRQHTKSR